MRVDDVASVKPPPPPAREGAARSRRPHEGKTPENSSPDRWDGSTDGEREREREEEPKAAAESQERQEETEEAHHLDARA